MDLVNRSAAWKGVGFVFLSAFMYASLPILGKMAFQAGLSPTGALFLRFAFSLVLTSFYIRLFKHIKVFQLTVTTIAQGIFLTMGALFYFYSLKYLAASITGVLFFAYPVVVAILAIPVYKEKLKPRLLLALILAVTGIILVSNPGRDMSEISNTGAILALLACFSYACYCLIGQKSVASHDPLSIMASISLIAVVMIGFLSGRDLAFLLHLSWNQVLIGLTLAIVNTILGLWLFLKGIQIIGASRAALVSSAEPPLIILLAFLVLGETLTLLQVLGSLLVFTSMFLSLKSESDQFPFDPSVKIRN